MRRRIALTPSAVASHAVPSAKATSRTSSLRSQRRGAQRPIHSSNRVTPRPSRSLDASGAISTQRTSRFGRPSSGVYAPTRAPSCQTLTRPTRRARVGRRCQTCSRDGPGHQPFRRVQRVTPSELTRYRPTSVASQRFPASSTAASCTLRPHCTGRCATLSPTFDQRPSSRGRKPPHTPVR